MLNRNLRRRSRSVSIESLEPRRLLTTVSWAAPVSGSFGDATKWSTGNVPGPADDVLITAPGLYTVDVSADVSVRSLRLGGGTGPAGAG